MTKVITAPEQVEYKEIENNVTLFLAGSIESGKASLWQDEIIKQLSVVDNLLIFNPRRPVWTDLDQKNLELQIEWELMNLDRSDIIYFYFDPNTQSPVTLLELGLFHERNIIVYCPKEYFRHQNIVTTGHMMDFFVTDDYEESVDALFEFIDDHRDEYFVDMDE